jgi:outer membrane protein OmpA-like peptidoglycan-associated protein
MDMTTRRFTTLLISALLFALSGFAQQTSNLSTQPAAASGQPLSSSQSAEPREPIPPDNPTNFWDGDDPNVVNLVTHPFANKKYVQRHTRPIVDRLNELDEITSENAKAIKDADSRAQQGLQLASDKVNLADQHATDASNKAQLARTNATQASARVSAVDQRVSNLDQYKGSAQTEIRFRPGQFTLSMEANDALDQMAVPLKSQRAYMIEIQGFASGRGQSAIIASQKMADSVVRYLVLNHQIPVYRISTLSMGSAPMSGDVATAKRTSGGRVEVNLLTNDALSSAQH